MKKLFLIFTVLTLFIACTKSENLTLEEVDGPPVPSAENLVKKQLLGRLESFLQSVDPKAGRPVRHVKNIRNLSKKHLLGQTRSDEAGFEDLAYIVEFENGEGSAILGIDERIDPIVAVLDHDVLTVEDFTNPNTDLTDIRAYVVNNISEYLKNATLEKKPQRLIEPIKSTYFEDSVAVLYSLQVPAMVMQKWNQRSPFNNHCPVDEYGNHKLAGCAPIATAQLIAHNLNAHSEAGITINSIYFATSDLQYSYWYSIPSASVLDVIAEFIYQIGLSQNASYGTNSTGVNPDRIPIFLRSVNYANVSMIDYDTAIAKNHIINSKPVILGGYREEISESGNIEIKGHSYLLDGWDEIIEEVWSLEKLSTLPHPGKVVSRTLLGQHHYTRVHLNMGWGGSGDGFYTEGTFNGYDINPKLVRYNY